MAGTDKAAQAYKDQVMKKAEYLITENFSQKIAELNELLDSSLFKDREPPFAKNQISDGRVECNKDIQRMVSIVRVELEVIMENAKTLILWINYLTPKVEDGNNFGVSVQESVQGEVQNALAIAQDYYSFVSDGFVTRAKIASKSIKYPTVESYRTAIDEFDRREYFRLRSALRAIVNCYATMHHVIITNLDKVMKPRSQRESDY